MEITNDGLFLGVSPNARYMEYVDNFISEAKQLVEEHGDTPKKTHIQRFCDTFEQSEGNDLNKQLLSELH